MIVLCMNNKRCALHIYWVFHCYTTESVYISKNLGRLWLAYTELQGDFCMLQFISVGSRHFTQSELSLGWSYSHEIKSVSFSNTIRQ